MVLSHEPRDLEGRVHWFKAGSVFAISQIENGRQDTMKSSDLDLGIGVGRRRNCPCGVRCP